MEYTSRKRTKTTKNSPGAGDRGRAVQQHRTNGGTKMDYRKMGSTFYIRMDRGDAVIASLL